MSLINSYLITTKNLERFLNALTSAKAPERFTQKFLESLEFKSANDRLFIGLLKGLGFLDENGVPKERYYRFLDQTQSKQELAKAIEEAYSDLFAIKTNANELTVQEVKNKFRTLTQGKKTEDVLHSMANTFHALCGYADWSAEQKQKNEEIEEQKPSEAETAKISENSAPSKTGEERTGTELHYNIQIHLPVSRDQAVYDAIFKSLKDHLF